MGIKGLMQLIQEEAPESFKETEKKNYFGRKIAIDASMQLYQAMIMVRSSGEGGGPGQLLANEAGEITSHIYGIFQRAVGLLEKGLKPVFVFDGKPPSFKGGELAKRTAAKKKAQEDLSAAETRLKEGDENAVADINKAMKRTVRVTKEHNEDVKKLLRLMGIPVIEAPCEAEAQCAELCKQGVVFATATEDMDALTFRTPILLRKLTVPDSHKLPVIELHYERVIGGLNLDKDQFVDLCILSGCDYCDPIKGIGKKTALKLIKEHKNIETVLKNIDREKYHVPEILEKNLDDIRDLFNNPEVVNGKDVSLSCDPMNEEELTKYLVDEKQFAADRVARAIERIKKAKSTGGQSRMDSFFKPTGTSNAGFNKRKADDKKGGKGKKRKGATRGRGRR